MTRRDIYQQVTDTIRAALEAGTIPWRKPWEFTGEAGLHRNMASNRPYRGINQWLLSLAGFPTPYWLTFKQARDLGGNVKAGEKSTMIVFWKQLTVKDRDDADKTKTIYLLKHYNVFNVSQCEGIDVPVFEEPADFDPIVEAQAIIDGMPDAPPIKHHGDRACYFPQFDEVHLPVQTDFKDRESYYSTAFHELVHSTGHEKRLARDEVMKFDTFGSEQYSREELTAEFGASYLCGMAGISPLTVKRSAAYIKGWLKALDNDPKMVVLAASKGMRAADFIIDADEAEQHEDKQLVLAA
jgi:antirestriction protein ArdC